MLIFLAPDKVHHANGAAWSSKLLPTNIGNCLPAHVFGQEDRFAPDHKPNYRQTT